MGILKSIINFMILMTSLSASAFAEGVNWSGQWEGKLTVSKEESIQLIINIEQSNSDYSASMDVPAQHGYGLKFNQVNIQDEKIALKMNSSGMEYQGSISGDIIQGTYLQGNAKLPLQLKRVVIPVQARSKKQQEPIGELPYLQELVKFVNKSGNHFLKGTLTIPTQPIKHVAILISGSGPSTRDSDVYGHKFFLVIADQLARKGVAVLRYDDRGVAESGGNFATATTGDFATDANAAFDYLKSQPRFKQAKIGFIGHSEGGLIGAIAASENSKVDFHVSLAGPGTTGAQVLIDQNDRLQQLSGFKDEKRLENNQKQTRIMQAIADDYSVHQIAQILVELGAPQIEAERESQVLSSPWMRFFVKADPVRYYRQLDIPVLALNGELDMQVLARKNLEAIKSARLQKKETLTQTKSYPELNHLFQPAITGLPNEYGAIKITCSTEVLEDIANWIQSINS